MSLAVFPRIQGTALAPVNTQLPFTKSREFRTDKVEMDCGIQYGYRHRTDPLRRWTINCPCITDAEVTILEDFFRSCRGRLVPFSFTDPDDLYELKVRFDADDLDIHVNGPDNNALSIPIVEDRTP